MMKNRRINRNSNTNKKYFKKGNRTRQQKIQERNKEELEIEVNT